MKPIIPVVPHMPKQEGLYQFAPWLQVDHGAQHPLFGLLGTCKEEEHEEGC